MLFKEGFFKVTKGLLVVAATAGFAAQSMADEYIVKFKTKGDVYSHLNAKSIEGADITDIHEVGKLALIEMGKASPEAVAKRLVTLMARSDVEYVVKNIKMYAFGTPDDPSYSQQWALPKVNAPAAWDMQVGSRNTTVAVIDTGVDYTHPDLAENIWTNPNEIAGNGIDDDGNGYVDDTVGWDFRDNDRDPMDETSSKNPGHGTHCSGIVGAVGNNGRGVSGMSQEVSIIPVRFLGADGSGDLMSAAKAIDYSVALKADVISASWGAKTAASGAQPIIEAIGRANDAGIPFIAAAANAGTNNDVTEYYPANTDFPNVISVAASTNADAKPSWSNYGRATVDLSSPGENIYSTLPGDKYQNLSGTSMATPLVAGLVAMLISHDESLTAVQAEAVLQQTGAKVQIETACMCRIDAKGALDALENENLIVIPTAQTLTLNETGKATAMGGTGPYTYAAADKAIVDMAADGSFTAKAKGTTTISVTDAAGTTTQSLDFRVAPDNGGGGGGGGGGGDCPLDPAMCDIMCLLDPTLPWCP